MRDERNTPQETSIQREKSAGYTTSSQIRTQRTGYTGCILLPALTFLIGIAVGIAAFLLFILLISGNRSPMPVATPAASPTPGRVSVQVDAATITPLVEQSVQAAQIPGAITNVQVQFAEGAQMTVTGNYENSIMHVPVSNPFTIEFQPFVNQCQLRVRILHADFAGVSVTGLAALFEDKLNQKLQSIPNTVAGNINYCLTEVHTDPAGLSATLMVIFLTPTPSADVCSVACKSGD